MSACEQALPQSTAGHLQPEHPAHLTQTKGQPTMGSDTDGKGDFTFPQHAQESGSQTLLLAFALFAPLTSETL